MTNDLALRPETTKSCDKLVTNAHQLTIKTAEDFKTAGQLIQDCHKLVKNIQADFKPAKDALNEAKRRQDQQEKNHIDPLLAARQYLSNMMVKYTNEQQALAKQEMLERQQQAQKEYEERALNQAATLEAMGRKDEADAIMERPAPPPPSMIEPSDKITGLREHVTYDIEIVDDALVPRIYWRVDEKAIEAFVKTTKGRQEIPGVKIIKNTKLIPTGR